MTALGGRHALLACVVALAACAERNEAALTPTDIQVVEAYVAAMNAGDVAAANALRCEESKIGPEDQELFAAELRRLTDDVGELGVDEVEVGDLGPSIRRPAWKNPVVVRYWLTLDGRRTEEPLEMVVMNEDGERQGCVAVTRHLARMQQTFDELLTPLPQPQVATLDQLMPPLPEDSRMVADQPFEPGPRPNGDFEDAWDRRWQTGDYGGGGIVAWRFPTADRAAEAARDHMMRVERSAFETFAVPEVPEATGVRFLAYEWLWVQPPTAGPYIDEIHLVLGDTYVAVTITALPAGADHDAVVALAQQVAELSRGAR